MTPAAVGDTIIISAFAYTTATTMSISDSGGNTWAPVVPLTTTTSGASMQSWQAIAKSTAATTIRVSFANGANYSLELVSDEFNGLVALDKSTGKGLSGTTNPITIGPLTPSQNGELLYAIGNGGAITGIAAGYTASASFDITRSQYQVLGSTTGAGAWYAASFATNSNGANAMMMFATFTTTAATTGNTGTTSSTGTTTTGSTTGTTTGTSTGTVTGSGLTPLNPSPAGTYGSSGQIPSFVVNQYGQITSAINVSASGASNSSSVSAQDIIPSGAVCDGVADDTAALQNAINQAQSTNGSLFIPPGKCKISSTLTINKALEIGGHQGTVCSDSSACGSQIYYTGTGTAIQVNGFITRVHFHDLTISSANGQGGAAVGVYLNQVEESGFDRVNIGDWGGSGNEKKGFTAAIKTNHFAIGWIRDCNFEDDQYVLDVEGGFYARVILENNNLYRVTAFVRADGGSSNLSILHNWLESVVYMVYVDSANARLQGAVIEGNHENTDAGSGNCSGLPCSSARMIKVTTGGGSLTSFMIAGNSINLSGGPSSFIDSAAPIDNFSLISNQLFGSPGSVFGGSASASAGTLANNMPSLGNATRLSQ